VQSGTCWRIRYSSSPRGFRTVSLAFERRMSQTSALLSWRNSTSTTTSGVYPVHTTRGVSMCLMRWEGAGRALELVAQLPAHPFSEASAHLTDMHQDPLGDIGAENERADHVSLRAAARDPTDDDDGRCLMSPPGPSSPARQSDRGDVFENVPLHPGRGLHRVWSPRSVRARIHAEPTRPERNRYSGLWARLVHAMPQSVPLDTFVRDRSIFRRPSGTA
jgi:hypothetical protein